jgi:hypothetical protein
LYQRAVAATIYGRYLLSSRTEIVGRKFMSKPKPCIGCSALQEKEEEEALLSPKNYPFIFATCLCQKDFILVHLLHLVSSLN